MSNIEKLRTVVQTILSSYESKVNIVISLMREVEQKIIRAYEDQNSSIKKIRDILAKTRNLRKGDFDQLMKPIVDLQNHRKEQIHKLLEDICCEEDENISELKKILTGKNSSSMDDFYVLKKKILSRPSEREAELSELLKSFHQDQAELDAILRRLLKKGDNIRLKDLKRAIWTFQADHFGDGILVDDILREFSEIKEEISHQWEAVVNTVGLRKFAAQATEDYERR